MEFRDFWSCFFKNSLRFIRITAKHFKLTRPGTKVGRYKMIRKYHESSKADPARLVFILLNAGQESLFIRKLL